MLALMSNSKRIRIAALVTALFLMAVTAAGVVARGPEGPDKPATSAAVMPQPDQSNTSLPSNEPTVGVAYGTEDGYAISEEADDESFDDEYGSSEESEDDDD